MDIKRRIELINLLQPDPVTAELGVAEGNFSQDICREWNPSKHYCVDNWAKIPDTRGDGNFPQEWHNMNYHAAIWKMYEYRHKVEFLKGITWEMARHIKDDSLDLCYVDANHSFEGVTQDIKAWFPKVKEGGVMAFHDYFMPQYGVLDSVHEFCRGRFQVYVIEEEKTEDAGAFFIKI